MSGQEFDTAALVRVFNNTDLGVVRAAIREAGLGDGLQGEAAVSVLEELDDEIRLLRRYRVAQENSAERIVGVIRDFPRNIAELLVAAAALTGLGTVAAIFEIIGSWKTGITSANNANLKATRLARAKLDDLIETRGKISVLLQ